MGLRSGEYGGRNRRRAPRARIAIRTVVFMAGEIVEDDDVARLQHWAELVFDPLGKARAIDWLIEHEGRVDPVTAARRDKGHRLPMAVMHLGVEPLANRSPASQWCHVRLRPSLIDKNEASRIRPVLELFPLLPPPCHLGPQLFGGKNAFFEAQTLGMGKTPDLHIIDLHAPLCQFGDKTPQGEVALGPIQKSGPQNTAQTTRLVGLQTQHSA